MSETWVDWGIPREIPRSRDQSKHTRVIEPSLDLQGHFCKSKPCGRHADLTFCLTASAQGGAYRACTSRPHRSSFVSCLGPIESPVQSIVHSTTWSLGIVCDTSWANLGHVESNKLLCSLILNLDLYTSSCASTSASFPGECLRPSAQPSNYSSKPKRYAAWMQPAALGSTNTSRGAALQMTARRPHSDVYHSANQSLTVAYTFRHHRSCDPRPVPSFSPVTTT